MTKEQAIEELRISECYSVMPSVEALDMAIKALEQQPCDDCISRQEVLENPHNYCCYVLANQIKGNYTPIPDNLTNGDMIKAMFPNMNFGTLAQDDVIVNKNYSNNDEPQVFIPIKVWNAPYKR